MNVKIDEEKIRIRLRNEDANILLSGNKISFLYSDFFYFEILCVKSIDHKFDIKNGSLIIFLAQDLFRDYCLGVPRKDFLVISNERFIIHLDIDIKKLRVPKEF